MSVRHSLLMGMAMAAMMVAARAHAFLDHADPRVGSAVAAPHAVKVWMTETLEPTFSRLQVFDAAGKEVDARDVKVSDETMIVSLPALPPGLYKVVWKVVATDTHHTSGTFSFTIR